LEQYHEGAESLFEALQKSFDENITRINKLLERLAHEQSMLTKRSAALKDARTRARAIKKLAVKAEAIRSRQCRRTKVRNARLRVSIQKIRSIVAQIEEILQERFGKLKSFFIERKVRID